MALHAKSMWWEVNAHLIFFLNFIFSEKYTKFNFCIDMNLHALATVLRTPVMTDK